MDQWMYVTADGVIGGVAMWVLTMPYAANRSNPISVPTLTPGPASCKIRVKAKKKRIWPPWRWAGISYSR
jgi:hypothetical protein